MSRPQSTAEESLDPLNVSLSEQNNHTTGLCVEMIDSKDHLKALRVDQKIKINYDFEDDNGRPSNSTICDHTKQLTDLDTKITQCIYQNTETHLKLEGFRETLGLLLNQIGLEECTPLNDFDRNDVDEENDMKKPAPSDGSMKFDVIERKITKCISSNKLTHLKIDNLQRSLDLVLENIENLLRAVSDQSQDLLHASDKDEMFRFPISSVNELNRLDEELQQNEEFMSKLVAKFSKIAGDSGNKSAKKVGVKIIERIISPKLLTKFTWTGRTNGPNNTKLAFITYSSIFYLCLQVISKADRTFDTNACENFLKNNILKHSSMRLSRKFNKNVKRSKSTSDETWSITSKRVKHNTPLESHQSKSPSLQSNAPEQQQVDKDDDACAEEENLDSKANVLNFLNIEMETNNNSEVESENKQCLLSNSFQDKCEHESKLDVMDRKISHCIESNTKVHSKIDTLQNTLNVILSKIVKCNGFRQDLPTDPVPLSSPESTSASFSAIVASPTPTSDPEIFDDGELDSFYFPITSVSDLQDFNKKLSKSETFEKRMIEKFFRIVAKNIKKMSYQRFGIEVVESVISPQLLSRFSWTGRPKSKLAFMKYPLVVNFFQKIISKVDKRFSRKECENFLRFTVFKYINMRIARKKQKTVDPMIESFCDVKQELDVNALSIEDLPMKASEK